jgi:hypothetical protein
MANMADLHDAEEHEAVGGGLGRHLVNALSLRFIRGSSEWRLCKTVSIKVSPGMGQGVLVHCKAKQSVTPVIPLASIHEDLRWPRVSVLRDGHVTGSQASKHRLLASIASHLSGRCIIRRAGRTCAVKDPQRIPDRPVALSSISELLRAALRVLSPSRPQKLIAYLCRQSQSDRHTEMLIIKAGYYLTHMARTKLA